MKYKISDLAKILDISTNTVRRYEEKGYIQSVRDESSGYRYYDDEGVFGIINAKLMRKHGFTHEELEEMMNYDIEQMMECYDKKLKEMDEKIAYMTNVRHRIKDDLLLMKKVKTYEELNISKNVAFLMVLYKKENKILTENKRLKMAQEFLYKSPEVQRVYVIRKENIDKGHFSMDMGWAIKEMHIEPYGMEENEYTERYASRLSLMGMVTLPISQKDIDTMSDEMIKERLLGKHLRYMEEHNFKIAGDIIAIIITSAIENGQEMQYLLLSVPIE
ncbi:MAG: MerR family transcriptional regulator [Lachnospira sp.]|nr:MerR family transcriptional regulator [Lachnospira sp.]